MVSLFGTANDKQIFAMRQEYDEPFGLVMRQSPRYRRPPTSAIYRLRTPTLPDVLPLISILEAALLSTGVYYSFDVHNISFASIDSLGHSLFWFTPSFGTPEGRVLERRRTPSPFQSLWIRERSVSLLGFFVVVYCDDMQNQEERGNEDPPEKRDCPESEAGKKWYEILH